MADWNFRNEQDSPLITEEREILETDPDIPGIILTYIQPIQKKSENRNGRVYTEEFWENAFFRNEEAQKRMDQGLMIGRLAHPDEGIDVAPEKVSQRVTQLWDGKEESHLDNDLIYGKVEVFDTPAGNIQKTFVISGTKIGQSSRALVKSESRHGKEFMKDGDIQGWDAVWGPSVSEALPPDLSEEDIKNLESSNESIDFSSGLEEVGQQLKENSKDNEYAKLVCESINYEQDMPDQNQDEFDEDIKELYKEEKQKRKNLEAKIQDLKDEIKVKNEAIEDLKEQDKSSSGDMISLDKAAEKLQEATENMVPEQKAIRKIQELANNTIHEDQAIEKVQELFGFIQTLKQTVQEDYIKEEKVEVMAEQMKEHYQDLKAGAKQSVKKLLNKCDEIKQEMNQKHIDFAIKTLAEHRLKEMDREDDEGIRQHILSADTVKEARNRANEVQEVIESAKEGSVDWNLAERQIREIIDQKRDLAEETQSTLRRLHNC